MLSHRSTIVRLAPVLLTFSAFACGGGGGGGGGAQTSALNEGTYDVASFNYQDPKPASYHPLTKPVFPLVRRDEIVQLVSNGGPSIELEDPNQIDKGGLATPPVPAEATLGLTLINAVHADVDGDGRPDLVILGRVGNSGSAILRVNVLTFANSQWVKIASFDCNAAGDHSENESARVAAGDIDADGREEILVAGTLDSHSWVRVYEDPIQGLGFGVIAHEFAFAETNDVRAIAANVDDDGEAEVVLFWSPNNGKPGVYVMDDANHGYAPMSSVPLYSSNALVGVELVAMNRDDDAREEIAVIGMESNNTTVVRIFDDAAAGFATIRTYDPVNSGTWSPESALILRRSAAGDVDGDGFDDLVVQFMYKSGTTYTLHMRVHWGNGTITEKVYSFATSKLNSWDLAIADRNGDGNMEIAVGYMVTINASGQNMMYVTALTSDPSKAEKLSLQFGPVGFPLPAVTPLALSGDDFDMDGTRMRWKGVKFANLPDPKVMVVLAAPPTKKGISQNYDGTEMSYSTSIASSTSYETSWGASYSLSFGFDVDDPITNSGGEGKVTLKGAVEKSWGTEGTIQTSTSFTGGHDQDVVIFQGTLHMIYVYEFVSAPDPKAIGQEVAINIPLSTKIYKWTRSFFEDTFGSRSPLPADLFTHVIGNPKSYPTHASATATIDSSGDGFEGTSVTVGQGKGTNGLGLSMASCLTTQTKWTVEVEIEATAKIAGITFGGAYGFSHDWVWTTSTTDTTEYECRVGDIQQAGDWFTWGYDVGMFTYHRTTSDDTTFQVLGFWTDPWGSGYGF